MTILEDRLFWFSNKRAKKHTTRREPKDENKTRFLLFEQCHAIHTLFEDVGSRQGGRRPKESNIVVPGGIRGKYLGQLFNVCFLIQVLYGNYWVHDGRTKIVLNDPVTRTRGLPK
jgi:hypothetical protein